jgi:hypothetical protein
VDGCFVRKVQNFDTPQILLKGSMILLLPGRHLAMSRFRHRHIRDLQNLDPTVPIESHCFHDLPP